MQVPVGIPHWSPSLIIPHWTVAIEMKVTVSVTVSNIVTVTADAVRRVLILASNAAAMADS